MAFDQEIYLCSVDSVEVMNHNRSSIKLRSTRFLDILCLAQLPIQV